MGRHGVSLSTWVVVKQKIYGFDNRMTFFDGSATQQGADSHIDLELRKPKGFETPYLTENDKELGKLQFHLTQENQSGIPFIVENESEIIQISIQKIRGIEL